MEIIVLLIEHRYHKKPNINNLKFYLDFYYNIKYVLDTKKYKNVNALYYNLYYSLESK